MRERKSGALSDAPLMPLILSLWVVSMYMGKEPLLAPMVQLQMVESNQMPLQSAVKRMSQTQEVFL